MRPLATCARNAWDWPSLSLKMNSACRHLGWSIIQPKLPSVPGREKTEGVSTIDTSDSACLRVLPWRQRHVPVELGIPRSIHLAHAQIRYVRRVPWSTERGRTVLHSRAPLRFILVGLAATAVACGDAPLPTDTEPASEPAAAEPAPPPPYRIYVTNERSGDLTVIAGGLHQVLTTVPLGSRPRGITVSPDQRQLFVALSGSPPAPPGVDESTLPPPDRAADGIGVVDLVTRQVVTVLHGGTDPEQVSLSADGTRLYVANEDAGTTSVLDVESGEIIATLMVGGEPEGVTTSPDGRFVYVTSEQDNQVSVIDTAANEVIEQFEVGPRPRSAAFSPDGTRAYVTSENGGVLSIVDTTSHEVIATVDVPGDPSRPMGVVVSPDGGRVYVSTGRGRTVVAIDAVRGGSRGAATVGERPWGIALSPDGSLLYTANGPSNDVSVVDTETMTVVTTIPVGDGPWGIAIVDNR